MTVLTIVIIILYCISKISRALKGKRVTNTMIEYRGPRASAVAI